MLGSPKWGEGVGWVATLDLWLQGGVNGDINLNAKHLTLSKTQANPVNQT